VSQTTLSNLYWGTWIFVLFLVPELLAATHAIPMFTLSHTSWVDEANYPWLRTLIMGFLMGLAVHIRFATKFGPAEFGGVLIALVLQLCWGLA
jgi:hypothetical protein